MREDLRRLIEILVEEGSDYMYEVEVIAENNGFGFGEDGHLYEKDDAE